MTEDTAKKAGGGKGGNNRNRNRRGRNNNKKGNAAAADSKAPASGENKQQPQQKASNAATAPTNNNNNNAAKRGKNRNGRRARRGRNNKAPRMRGPPTAPQIKINLRNITSTEQYGSMNTLLTNLLQPLIDTTNEAFTTATTPKLYLDPSAITTLIHHEELAQKARMEWENRDKSTPDKEATDDAKEPSSEPPSSEYLTAATTNMPTEVAKPTTPPPTEPYIAVRILQAIPPHQTKRRGEKPGNIYLVWTAPSIEAKESGSAVNSVAGGPTSSKSVKSGGEKEDAPSTANASASDTKPDVTTASETTSVADENNTKTPKKSNTNNPQNKNKPPPPRVDYSREVAQRRLWLLQALEAAQQALQSHPTLGSCQIAEALNIKTFKPLSSTGQKLEGTIFESQDYRDFVERQETAEQELKARPRPVPGGVDHANTTTTGTDQQPSQSASSSTPSAWSSSAAPVPAIVLHLQAKKQEKALKNAMKQAQRKKETKSTNDDADKQAKKKKKGGRSNKGRGKKKATAAS